MRRIAANARRGAAALLVTAALAATTPASAQYQPTVADAGTGNAAAGTTTAASAPSTPSTPTAPSAESSAKPPPPDPGPAMRESSGRRRRANPASGVFLAVALVAVIGYGILKRLRR